MAICSADFKIDEGSVLKLDLLESYLTAWLPVFIEQPKVQRINIFDFFSGPGKDFSGIKGSPYRVLRALEKYQQSKISQKVKVFFNDSSQRNVDLLRQELTDSNYTDAISLECLDYMAFFNKYLNNMKAPKSANFLFIDPFGILNPVLFSGISTIIRTDFLFFLPAHFFARFKNSKEFENKWPGISSLPTQRIRDIPANFSKTLLRPLMPRNFHLAHFAIQKTTGGRIHGVIFGSRSILGLYKFLEQCWKLDPINGESNFRLDGDLPELSSWHSLPGLESSGKVRNFKQFLRTQLLSGKLATNKDIFYFTAANACLPRHAREVLQDLKKEGRILNTIPVSYSTILKNNNIQRIVLL